MPRHQSMRVTSRRGSIFVRNGSLAPPCPIQPMYDEARWPAEWIVASLAAVIGMLAIATLL